MFGLVLNCESVILLPATKANAVEDAVFAVPLVAPPAADVIEVKTVPTVLVATPIMVMAGLVLFCERVIPVPATNGNAEDDAVFTVPDDAPPATVVMETRVE
jgi:hypothetical protein